MNQTDSNNKKKPKIESISRLTRFNVSFLKITKLIITSRVKHGLLPNLF